MASDDDTVSDLIAPQPESISTTQRATIESLLQLAELRQPGASAHNQRVGLLAAQVAQTLGLPQRDIALIHQAAPLHDIGTIAIPEKILHKPGRLSPDEFEVVKSHISIGLNLLQHGQSEVCRMARLIIASHHERFDGSGYPSGKRGMRIPLIGQIVAVADVYDTLSHDQPYRPAYSPHQAARLIHEQSGSKFDPQVVTALLKTLEQHGYFNAQPAKTHPPVLMKGYLGTLTLYELLQLFIDGHKSCQLEVAVGVSRAVLRLDAGQLRYASFATHEGEVAILALLAALEHHPHAKFTVTSWQPALKPSPTNITTPSQKLLLELAVALDHRAVKRPR